MVTRISTKGQAVIASAIRRLGLRPGDALDVKAEGERVVLAPQKKRAHSKARIVIDPVSGLPAVTWVQARQF